MKRQSKLRTTIIGFNNGQDASQVTLKNQALANSVKVPVIVETSFSKIGGTVANIMQLSQQSSSPISGCVQPVENIPIYGMYTYSNGVVGTFAGSTAGFLNGIGTAARFDTPSGIAAYSDNLYIADMNNNRIRVISSLTANVTNLAGNGTLGFVNGAAASAQFNNPMGVAVDSVGNVYVADTYNHVIRRISAGTVTTFAG